MPRSKAPALLLAPAVIIAIIAVALPPIPQPLSYHQFADQRAWLGIPNFGDVVSNLPFAIVGICGLIFLLRPSAQSRFADPRERWFYIRWIYMLMFAGLLLTAFGSSYYHRNPNNATLVWDRLPMTLGFMSLLAAMIGERISLRAGLASLAPLLAFGLFSVVYWDVTESRGHGDLRLYALTQFGSLLVLLLLLALFPARYTRGPDFMVALGFYVLAKALEVLDRRVFHATRGAMSGHALKHIAAAFAAYWILRMLKLRAPVPAPLPSGAGAKA